uniref:(northern house mosquito) hypothetical protein n=1 Tax=Culex pipiens TaxID=7175 RepID=A0A8D8BHJ0_CULPI
MAQFQLACTGCTCSPAGSAWWRHSSSVPWPSKVCGFIRTFGCKAGPTGISTTRVNLVGTFLVVRLKGMMSSTTFECTPSCQGFASSWRPSPSLPANEPAATPDADFTAS